MPKQPKYDPTRLTALARTRDTRKATGRALNDEVAELRLQRQDVRRRAELMRGNAEYMAPHERVDAIHRADGLDEAAAQIEARISELEPQAAEAFAAGNDAGRSLTACLAFAREHDLPIPATLRDHGIDKNFGSAAVGDQTGLGAPQGVATNA